MIFEFFLVIWNSIKIFLGTPNNVLCKYRIFILTAAMPFRDFHYTFIIYLSNLFITSENVLTDLQFNSSQAFLGFPTLSKISDGRSNSASEST